MAHEPKKKHSKAAKRTRRAAISVAAANLVVCKNCGQKTFSHMVCRSCNFYDGRKTKGGKDQVKVVKA